MCAAAIHGLAESVQRGGPEEHIADAVVAIACAAAERNPDACTTSSQQVYQDFADPEVHLTGMAFLWLQTDTDTHWHNLLLSHQARSREVEGDSGAQEAYADGATTQAQDLAEAVLLCLQKASRGTCETAIDYFEALSMVPVSERAPFFAEPLCRRLLHALLQQACYPADFTSWSKCIDDDENDFKRFRYRCISMPDNPLPVATHFVS